MGFVLKFSVMNSKRKKICNTIIIIMSIILITTVQKYAPTPQIILYNGALYNFKPKNKQKKQYKLINEVFNNHLRMYASKIHRSG